MSEANSPDGVLPFDQSDVVNAVGPVRQIVSLDEYAHAERVVGDGRCQFCGYDRGDYRSHTELAVWSVTCRQCDSTLGGEQ